MLPEPENGSSTTPPGRRLLASIASINATGFIVGCSALQAGLSTSNTVVDLLSPNQRSPPRPNRPSPPGTNPYRIGSCRYW
ncbi:Uncharacterised protein [Mycobacteroides abscessus subsp. abscessus]|nr:Uncharacterised protein [Mycobacteroides abscessus subsp. abscessus]